MTQNSGSPPLLEIRDLTLGFRAYSQKNPTVNTVVKGVNLRIGKGETLAIVGESGSGKSVTALSVIKLLDSPPLVYEGGSVLWQGEELLDASESRLRQIRGHDISVIFQEPLTALNPLHRIHRQITEVIERHQGLSKSACEKKALEWLQRVGIRNPEAKMQAYPHELSGGERQRVMIAMALVNDPKLLIADEPTTALDVTIQAQILKLIKDLQAQLGMAVLFISHDLHIVKQVAEHVVVMEKGHVVESGLTRDVLETPQHPYSQKLVSAEPHGNPPGFDTTATPLLQVDDLKCWFPVHKGLFKRVDHYVKAVDGISLDIRPGESVGIVGESGSGKSTLGRSILRLVESRGGITFKGHRIDGLDNQALKPFRRDIQVVFQDPYGSLSPRMTVREIVGEGLEIHQIGSAEERVARIAQALAQVDLNPEWLDRYPNEFSGGQRQRICIARSLVLEPKLLILDEPTSALDRTIQQQVIELLQRLQAEMGLSYLFISHDLRVVRALCHRVLVMRAGEVIEFGSAEALYRAPEHPYTQELLRTAMLENI